MSTNIPSKWTFDPHGAEVNKLVTESAFFSSINSLVDYRRNTDKISKVVLADRMDKDKGTITRLTSHPSNMKISTIADFGYALGARAVLVFIANEDSRVVFTSTGMHVCGAMQIEVSSVSTNVRRVANHAHMWIGQTTKETADA